MGLVKFIEDREDRFVLNWFTNMWTPEEIDAQVREKSRYYQDKGYMVQRIDKAPRIQLIAIKRKPLKRVEADGTIAFDITPEALGEKEEENPNQLKLFPDGRPVQLDLFPDIK